ncbi:MAG: NADH-quinone oxidoreductase subunit C, partial [Halobacteria archaeon]|nr:NADH-quinone oxidoreductase subunit C [Halobacteria archaeon]
TFALDLYGELSVIFMYAMKERETIMEILEDLTGQRQMFNYLRLGGVAYDLPEPREEWFQDIHEFLDSLPEKMNEYYTLLDENELFRMRTEGTGVLEPEQALEYGCTGPQIRASGIAYDLRKVDPYAYYENLDFDVVTYDGCDNRSRMMVRLGEIEESARIIRQCVEILEDWNEEYEIRTQVPRSVTPEQGKEIYSAVEAAKGELGIYIVSDGSEQPHRFKIRSPCFSNLAAFAEMTEGEYLADMLATLGTIDLVFGEVDR